MRFVAIPVPALNAKLDRQMNELDTDATSLGKRLHYLETTAKNSQDHIDQMLRRGGGEAAGSS